MAANCKHAAFLQAGELHTLENFSSNCGKTTVSASVLHQTHTGGGGRGWRTPYQPPNTIARGIGRTHYAWYLMDHTLIDHTYIKFRFRW